MQLTALPVGAQVAPGVAVVATTPVTLAGTVSVMVTPWASEGPSLRAVRVKLIAWPAVTVALAVLVMTMLADAPVCSW